MKIYILFHLLIFINCIQLLAQDNNKLNEYLIDTISIDISSGESYAQHTVLPSQDYDSIFYFQSYIITKKDKAFSIFDTNNKPLLIKGLRTIHIKNNIQGIAKNKHFYITHTGKIVYTKEKGWKKEPQFEDTYNMYDIIPTSATSYYIEKNDNFFYIKNDDGYLDHLNSGVVYIWEPNIDSLYFLNNDTNWYRIAHFDYYFDVKFIFNKGGKLGLGTFSSEKTQYSPFSLETILPPIFDIIEPYVNLNNIFDPHIDQRVFLHRDELVGLFPIHSDARYLKLRIYGEFARFMLPSGKKGWLNTITGEELLDQ